MNLDEVLSSLTEEALPEIDYNAPEAGAFPPKLYPGVYTNWGFKLPDNTDELASIQEIETEQGQPKKKFLQVTFTASIDPRLTPDKFIRASPEAELPEEVLLKFQRASFYQSAKMKAAGMNSQGGELLRNLGLRVEPLTPQNIVVALQGADGRARGTGIDVGWEVYDKGLDIRISTHPNKKKKDIAWPRGADGKYELMATFPNGQKAYGRETIMRFKGAAPAA